MTSIKKSNTHYVSLNEIDKSRMLVGNLSFLEIDISKNSVTGKIKRMLDIFELNNRVCNHLYCSPRIISRLAGFYYGQYSGNYLNGSLSIFGCGIIIKSFLDDEKNRRSTLIVSENTIDDYLLLDSLDKYSIIDESRFSLFTVFYTKCEGM